jgi:hypothetical protein
MFCNKCGKTLHPEATACSSCGQPAGDSRFEGSGYTSSQVRFVPEGGERPGYAPYTKTTYSSMSEEGGDVYSRTSYRPALSEEESRETTGLRDSEPAGQEEPAAQPGPEEDEEQPASQAQAPDEAREQPADEKAPAQEVDALGIAIKPLEPIKKTGISPEVQRYIQQMNQQKTRRQHKEQDGQDAGEPGAEDALGETASAASKPLAARWAMRIAGVLAVVVLLAAGVILVAYLNADKAKIPGVTYTVYTQGLAMIKSHASTEYREGLIQLWRADNTGALAMTQQQSEREQLAALMPEKGLDNDQGFVDTLLSIQDSIENATATDAVAVLSSSSMSVDALSEASEESWLLINNAITRLENATDASELSAIVKGVDLSVIQTPEPEITPTPVPYRTLKKGMKNNKQVTRLQDRLYRLGWFNGVRDGDFGPATQTAVKKFQNAVGVKEDGIATPELQEMLFAEDAPRGDDKTAAPAATPSPQGDEQPDA